MAGSAARKMTRLFTNIMRNVLEGQRKMTDVDSMAYDEDVNG